MLYSIYVAVAQPESCQASKGYDMMTRLHCSENHYVFVLQRNRLSLFRLRSSISALWLKVHEEEKWTGKFWQLLLQKSENQRCRDGSRWGISVFRPSVHHSVIQIKATSEPESAEMNAAWCGKNNVNQCDSRTITYSSSLTLTPISHLLYK